MKYFKLTSEMTYEGNLYKEGQEFRIIDNEVIDDNGEWLFDSDSLLASQYGTIIEK